MTYYYQFFRLPNQLKKIKQQQMKQLVGIIHRKHSPAELGKLESRLGICANLLL